MSETIVNSQVHLECKMIAMFGTVLLTTADHDLHKVVAEYINLAELILYW